MSEENKAVVQKVYDAINAGAGAESVVVLARDVAPGEKITPDMLTTKTVPASALPRLFSRNLRDRVHRRSEAEAVQVDPSLNKR